MIDAPFLTFTLIIYSLYKTLTFRLVFTTKERQLNLKSFLNSFQNNVKSQPRKIERTGHVETTSNKNALERSIRLYTQSAKVRSPDETLKLLELVCV